MAMFHQLAMLEPPRKEQATSNQSQQNGGHKPVDPRSQTRAHVYVIELPMSSVRWNPAAQNDLPNIGDSEHEKAQEQHRKTERELCSSFHEPWVRSIILRSWPSGQ